MNEAKQALKKDIAHKERQKRELQREKQRLNDRRAELRKRGAPDNMLARYDIDIMELTEQINLKNEELFKLRNGW